MKRVIKFQKSDNGYSFLEGDVLVFEVTEPDLQFDVKKFYNAFFADDKDYSEISLENIIESDANATRVFKCTEQLITDIVKRLDEELGEKADDDKANAEPAG